MKLIWFAVGACIVLVALLTLVLSTEQHAVNPELALAAGGQRAPIGEPSSLLEDRGAPVEQRSAAERAPVVENKSRPAAAAASRSTDHHNAITGRVYTRPSSGRKLEHGLITVQLIEPGPDVVIDLTKVQRSQEAQGIGFGADGLFAIDDLALGTWKVRCTSPGFLTAERQFVLGRDPPLEIELSEPQDLCVRLVDAGGRPLSDPLPGMKFAIADVLDLFVSSTLPVRGERPNSHGGALTFRASRSEPGSSKWYQVRDLADAKTMWIGAALGESTLVFEEIFEVTEDVTLVLSPDVVRAALGSIEISVVDAQSGRPLQGVKLELAAGRPNLWPKETTDLRGQAAFQFVLPHNYEVVSELAGYAIAHASVAVSMGSRAHVDLRLERSVSISGVVQSESGGASSATVRLSFLSSNSFDGLETVILQTKPDGSFTADRLAPREYFVMAAMAKSGKVHELTSTELADASALPKGVVYVDARLGNVAGIVLTPSNPVLTPGSGRR